LLDERLEDVAERRGVVAAITTLVLGGLSQDVEYAFGDPPLQAGD
jgi:hypothetical protein